MFFCTTLTDAAKGRNCCEKNNHSIEFWSLKLINPKDYNLKEEKNKERTAWWEHNDAEVGYLSLSRPRLCTVLYTLWLSSFFCRSRNTTPLICLYSQALISLLRLNAAYIPTAALHPSRPARYTRHTKPQSQIHTFILEATLLFKVFVILRM